MKITIDTTSFEVMFQVLEKEVKQFASSTVDALGNYLVQTARATDKFNHGETFNSGIQFTKQDPLSGEVNCAVYNSQGVEYSNFLEYGNAPVDGKRMTFQIGGHWITTYKRKAIAPQHLGFFSTAVEQTIQQLPAILDQELDKLK